jgi:SAM-dependent methyltransferase
MALPQVPRERHNGVALNWGGIPEDKRARFLHPGELAVIASLLRGKARVVEFGCQNGRTARVLLDSLPGIEHYIGIDVLPGYVPAKAVQRGEVPDKPGEFALGDDRFRAIVRERGSYDVQAGEISPVDAAFIDGDHSREGVLNDYRLARAAMRRGGILLFHDYHDRVGADGKPEVDVAEVLHELYLDGLPLVHVAGTWIAYAAI